MVTASSTAMQSPAKIWPLLISPIAAGLYYVVVKSAFEQSIGSVLGPNATADIAPGVGPYWGSHWFYRFIADAISIGIGTFVAAGLAHGRERAAALVGGCIISLGFVARIAMAAYVWRYGEAAGYSLSEPWYQYGIDGLMIIAAPVIGSYVAEVAAELHAETPAGFGGIARVHFAWLWIAAHFYALGLIAPMAAIYGLGDRGVIGSILVFLVNGIPAVAVAVPGYVGLGLLAGHLGTHMGAVMRNTAGIVVLIIGGVIGAAIQYGWFLLAQTIYQALTG